VTVAAAATASSATGYRMTRVGLVIERELTQQEWTACGRKLAAFASSTAFAIGDWLVYGSGRGEWGETYEPAQRLTGKSFESLSQYARVSTAFPIDLREESTPWSIYRAALPLPDEDRLRAVRVAAANGWTRFDMDRFVQARGHKTLDEYAQEILASQVTNRRKVSTWRPPDQQGKKARVACPNCGHQFEIRRKS
jgi:hypothetical protein